MPLNLQRLDLGVPRHKTAHFRAIPRKMTRLGRGEAFEGSRGTKEMQRGERVVRHTSGQSPERTLIRSRAPSNQPQRCGGQQPALRSRGRTMPGGRSVLTEDSRHHHFTDQDTVTWRVLDMSGASHCSR